MAEYILRYDGGASDRFAFWVRNAANTAYAFVLASSFGSPTTGQWSLLIAQHDSVADNISIQINNGAIDATSHNSGVYQNTYELNVGSQLPTPTLVWNGRLGPIQVWKNRTLDATARTALYNAGAGLTYATFTT